MSSAVLPPSHHCLAIKEPRDGHTMQLTNRPHQMQANQLQARRTNTRKLNRIPPMVVATGERCQHVSSYKPVQRRACAESAELSFAMARLTSSESPSTLMPNMGSAACSASLVPVHQRQTLLHVVKIRQVLALRSSLRWLHITGLPKLVPGNICMHGAFVCWALCPSCKRHGQAC